MNVRLQMYFIGHFHYPSPSAVEKKRMFCFEIFEMIWNVSDMIRY